MGEITKLEDQFVAKSAIRTVVKAELQKMMQDFLAPAIGRAIREIRGQIEAGFRDAMAEFSYKGSWSEGVTYRRGNFVSTGGNLWHCDHDNTNIRPGAGNNWSLVCKSGRDGRDGKDFVLEPPESERRTVRTQR